MEHLVKVRPMGRNIWRRVGRLDENQEAVNENRKPVGEKFVYLIQNVKIFISTGSLVFSQGSEDRKLRISEG